MTTIYLKPKKEESLKRFHPWVFSGAIARVVLDAMHKAAAPEEGELVCVRSSAELAPYFLIEDKDKKPIVVLDDVMSELDKTHQDKLLKFLEKLEQVFITSTKLNVKNASIYEVKKANITRRNA